MRLTPRPWFSLLLRLLLTAGAGAWSVITAPGRYWMFPPPGHGSSAAAVSGYLQSFGNDDISGVKSYLLPGKSLPIPYSMLLSFVRYDVRGIGMTATSIHGDRATVTYTGFLCTTFRSKPTPCLHQTKVTFPCVLRRDQWYVHVFPVCHWSAPQTMTQTSGTTGSTPSVQIISGTSQFESCQVQGFP